MSILIKGMEMPTSCPCELIGVGYDLTCSFAGGIPARVKEYYECCQNGTRPSWCPLVTVPPHGRCIDVDALTTSTAVPIDGKPYQYVHIDNIKAAPTIIPAEEGET